MTWVALKLILQHCVLRLLRLWASVLAFLLIAPVAWAVEIGRFQVVGGDDALRAQLRGASLLSEVVQEDGPVTAVQVLAAANADYGRLLRVLYAQGYFGAVIQISLDGQEAATLSAFELPTVLRGVTYRIVPGKPYRFGAVSVAPLAPASSLPKTFARGEIAEGPQLQAALDGALLAWREAGHAKVSVASQSVVANHESLRLDAQFRLYPGQVIAFGELRPTSESAVRENRILQIAGLPKGARFSPQVVDKVAERLRRTGAFSSVTLTEADGIGPDGRMDILLDVKDAKPRKLGFGAELSSFEGVRVTGFWMHRNFLGGAERLRFDAEISGIGGQSGGVDYAVSAHLERPAVFGPDTNIFTFIDLRYDDEPSFNQHQGDIGLGVSRVFNDRIKGDVSAVLKFNETRDALGVRRFEMLAFPTHLQWDDRDDALSPGAGVFADLGVTPFINLDGSGAGANVNVDLRGYRALGGDGRVVLAGRAQVGATFGPTLAQIPGEFLYYSGGGGTVRGQPYQSLGVTQGGGKSGGAAYLGGSAEVRMSLENGFGLVGFVDVGFIADRPTQGGVGNWHSGAGLGLRYDTGIGPIRLDLGLPVSGATGQGVQLYVGIGQAF